jgi:hypothetical protein
MKRFEHWATRSLHSFLKDEMHKPFAWGQNDCCLFSANAIQSFTGVDVALDFRNKYTTKLGAFKAIKTITGGTTVEDAAVYCANKFGLKERIHPLMAQRGDLAVFHNGDEVIAGLVHLNGRSVVSVSDNGTVILPITTIKRSWSV